MTTENSAVNGSQGPSKVVSIRLDGASYEALAKRAAEAGKSVADFARTVLRDGRAAAPALARAKPAKVDRRFIVTPELVAVFPVCLVREDRGEEREHLWFVPRVGADIREEAVRFLGFKGWTWGRWRVQSMTTCTDERCTEIVGYEGLPPPNERQPGTGWIVTLDD